MPDREKHIASIPRIDPSQWEDYEGFRETFLLHIPDGGVAESLRILGKFLYDLLLEAKAEVATGESATRRELQAALAELRYLEGFVSSVGRESEVSSLPPDDIRLSQFAARQARELGTIAKRIEEELAA